MPWKKKMSIERCDRCGQHIDTDFEAENIREIDDEMVCWDCEQDDDM